jgi:hypothetical protein
MTAARKCERCGRDQEKLAALVEAAMIVVANAVCIPDPRAYGMADVSGVPLDDVAALSAALNLAVVGLPELIQAINRLAEAVERQTDLSMSAMTRADAALESMRSLCDDREEPAE